MSTFFNYICGDFKSVNNCSIREPQRWTILFPNVTCPNMYIHISCSCTMLHYKYIYVSMHTFRSLILSILSYIFYCLDQQQCTYCSNAIAFPLCGYNHDRLCSQFIYPKSECVCVCVLFFYRIFFVSCWTIHILRVQLYKLWSAFFSVCPYTR